MLMFHVLCKYIFILIGQTKDLLNPSNCTKLTVGGWQGHVAGKLPSLHSSKREEKQLKCLWQNNNDIFSSPEI